MELSEEIGWTDDSHIIKACERQEMSLIASDDVRRAASDGTFNHHVIVWIRRDRAG